MATLGEAVGRLPSRPRRLAVRNGHEHLPSSRPTPKGKYTMVTQTLVDRQPLGKSRHGTVRIGKRCRIKHADDAADHRIRQQRHHVQRPLPAGGGFQQHHQFDYDCNVGTGTSSSSAGNKDAHLLSDKGAIGWTAARVGGETGNVSEAPAGSKAEESARLHRMPATRDVSTRRPSAVSNPAKQSESGFHSITSEDRTPG